MSLAAVRMGSLAVSLLLLGSAGSLRAQENPLDAPVPTKGGATAPALAGAKITVPDFVKPGARFLYEAGSSTENDDPQKPNSAGQGLTRFDVIAVTDTHVLLNVGTFLPALRGNGYSYGGNNSVAFGDFEIRSGAALWIPKEVLEAYVTSDLMKVQTGPFELNGRKYSAKTMTRITQESALRQVWDVGTGLKLSEESGTGKARRGGDLTGFNRKTNGYSLYQTFRQMKLPWLDAPAPDWVKELHSMQYEGTQTMHVQGGAPLSVPFTSTLEVQERGDSWVRFAMTMGMQQAQAVKTSVNSGSGSVGGYWIHPDALRRMKEGLVDEDAMLGTRLEYSVQDGPQGRLGVLKETGAAHVLVWGYSLEDGAMVYGRWDRPEASQTTELRLVGRK
jgi:hypothetical protein